MKNFLKLFGIIALAAVIGFSMIACGGGGGGGGGSPVDPNGPGGGGITYTAAADDTADTGFINFTFSAPVSLTIDDITVTNETGAVMFKALDGEGKSWALFVAVVTAGNIKVQVNKTGIEDGSKTVAVYRPQGGGASSSTLFKAVAENTAGRTTAINFTFDASVSGLTANDITITPFGSALVFKGALSGGGTSWSLAVTTFKDGFLKVSIDKAGISSGFQYVVVYYPSSGTSSNSDGPILYNAVANNTAADNTDTTAINFTFSAPVSGLTASDINVSGLMGDVPKGALTGSGTSWSLAVTVAAAGKLIVSINKAGISGTYTSATVYKKWSQGDLITNTIQWNAAINQIKANPSGNYTLTIGGNFSVLGSVYAASMTFGKTASGSTLSVTLRGNGEVSLDSKFTLFCLEGQQTLIIDSAGLTLRGIANNSVAMIRIFDGATLQLKNGTITGNTSKRQGAGDGNGGGVLIDSGTFIMSGGTISGNTAANGGGAYISNAYGTGDGTFTMSGGTITGNTAADGEGGGVSFHGRGTFTMSGGTISNNTSVLDGGGASTGGIFNMDGGTISGNTCNRWGGGVNIGGTFTMKGGTISGNKTLVANLYSGRGGGLYMDRGTIRIVNGTIYGSNEPNTSLRNETIGATALGAALMINPNTYGGTAPQTAEYGTFSGTTWIRNGNLLTYIDPRGGGSTENTIRVENGVLQ